MGVPAFFRWLANRYPCVMLDLLEGKERGEFDRSTNASLVKETSGDFARWVQVDNLFIDCNGVVHPCCHPENGAPQPKNEREMLDNVGKYLDRLVAAVRPTKLVYLALDGCAPRAKMNQQRERRFCSAREAEESARAMGELLKRQGHKPSSKQRWDHNAITPGTPFMDSLATYCRTWASKAVAKQPSLRVVISDASTPGEGEHKIMDHIRRCGGEDERHAVCGPRLSAENLTRSPRRRGGRVEAASTPSPRRRTTNGAAARESLRTQARTRTSCSCRSPYTRREFMS